MRIFNLRTFQCQLHTFLFRIAPALLRQSVYGTLKFGIYYSLKNMIVSHYYDNDNIQENMYINVSCAATAGAFSSAVS